MIRYIASVRLLAEVGWVMILGFLYFLAETLVLGKLFPSLAIYLLPAGVFLVSAFSNPKRNIFAAFFLTLADLPLNIIRSFSDVISYIRLFAVGYATLVLAMSFNQMAAELGWGGPLRVIGAIIILLFGHSMNIILGGMAVLVHGVRLNMLEFSSHLEMSWSGRKFDPFRRRTSGHEYRKPSENFDF
jgi:V/A-type H+-transporting ATPase subunit I